VWQGKVLLPLLSGPNAETEGAYYRFSAKTHQGSPSKQLTLWAKKKVGLCKIEVRQAKFMNEIHP